MATPGRVGMLPDEAGWKAAGGRASVGWARCHDKRALYGGGDLSAVINRVRQLHVASVSCICIQRSLSLWRVTTADGRTAVHARRRRDDIHNFLGRERS